MEIGEKIKTIRKEKHMTQRELSEKTGISIPTLQRYENTSKGIKQDSLEKIANALDVSVLEILGMSYAEMWGGVSEDKKEELQEKAHDKDNNLHDLYEFLYRETVYSQDLSELGVEINNFAKNNYNEILSDTIDNIKNLSPDELLEVNKYSSNLLDLRYVRKNLINLLRTGKIETPYGTLDADEFVKNSSDTTDDNK